MTGFNETLDQFYERLTVGRCYVVSGGTIKQANPQYNKRCNLEPTLGDRLARDGQNRDNPGP